MSLINDALKRARQQSRPAAPVAADPALQPVLSTPQAAVELAPFIPWLAVLSLILATAFIFLWWQRSSPAPARGPAPALTTGRLADRQSPGLVPSNSANPHRDSGGVSPSAAPATSTAPAAQPTPIPPKTAPGSTNDVPLPQAIPAVVPALETSPSTNEPAFAPVDAISLAASFRLQGIFYRASKASAIINGEALFVGDEIQGARVTAIDRRSVRLEAKGTPIELKLH